MTTMQTPPAPSPIRVLRRRREGRVGAGVAAGLGDYFGFDPVLFRVLFATSAFFGGAGVIAYLIAWAAIPDEGTERAPIDGWAAALRRRRIPLWLVIGLAGLTLWLTAFSWWAPGPFLPVLGVVIILVVAFGRRDWRAGTAPATPVSLTKDAASPHGPTWVGDLRSWATDAQQAGRIRRRRSLPIRLGILGVLTATLIVLGIVDAVGGIPLPVYFWASLGIVGGGLVVGLASRRTPWSVTPLLVIATAGLIAFGGTHASLHDGIGQRDWRPTSAATNYRLAFGQADLDLRALPSTGPVRIDVTMAAGRLRIIAPATMNLVVDANVHFGRISSAGDVDLDDGVGLSRVVGPKAGASGVPVVVDVHLAAGEVVVAQP